VKALLEHIVTRLSPYYPQQEAEELAYWIIEETTGMNRFTVRTRRDAPVIPNLDDILDQLCRYVPVQYIFGHTQWLGLDLQVTPATLIPRPETAELVEKISHQENCQLSTVNCQLPFRVLDVGTGSGCIALALKQRHPDWQIIGIDISAEAIAVAQANARRNNLDVTFLQADLFAETINYPYGFSRSEELSTINYQLSTFNLLVSNPPYVRPSERATMTPNTLLHEPQQALFVPEDDPLIFYRRIAELRLAPELWLEINEHLGEEMLQLMQQLDYEAECLNDMYGKQRFIHATHR